MMPRPVAHYLIRFGSPERAEAAAGDRGGTACPDLPDKPPAEDPAFAIQAARDEGVAQGFAAARGECEAGLVQERLTFEARLAAERDAWTRRESGKLSEQIEAAFAGVESNIEGSVERVLRPFVVDALRRRMIDLLAGNVGVLLRGKERPVIEIRGAEDLLAMLREKLPALSAAIAYSPNDSIDVQIVAGQTVIESQIGAWIERIEALPE